MEVPPRYEPSDSRPAASISNSELIHGFVSGSPSSDSEELHSIQSLLTTTEPPERWQSARLQAKHHPELVNGGTLGIMGRREGGENTQPPALMHTLPTEDMSPRNPADPICPPDSPVSHQDLQAIVQAIASMGTDLEMKMKKNMEENMSALRIDVNMTMTNLRKEMNQDMDKRMLNLTTGVSSRLSSVSESLKQLDEDLSSRIHNVEGDLGRQTEELHRNLFVQSQRIDNLKKEFEKLKSQQALKEGLLVNNLTTKELGKEAVPSTPIPDRCCLGGTSENTPPNPTGWLDATVGSEEKKPSLQFPHNEKDASVATASSNLVSRPKCKAPLPTYRGETEWGLYYRKCRLIAKGNGWDDVTLFTNILAQLRDDASKAASSLHEDAGLDDLNALMEAKFAPALTKTAAQSRLQNCSQQRNQTLVTLAREITQWCEIAYPDWAPQTREEVAISHFARAMRSSDVARHVRMQAPPNMKLALQIAAQAEAILELERTEAKSSVRQVDAEIRAVEQSPNQSTSRRSQASQAGGDYQQDDFTMNHRGRGRYHNQQKGGYVPAYLRDQWQGHFQGNANGLV